VAARWPKAAFDLQAVQRFDPPLGRAAAVTAALLFLAVLGATSAFLWHAHTLALPAQAAGVAGIVALLWAVGVLTQPGISRSAPAPADGAAVNTARQNRA